MLTVLAKLWTVIVVLVPTRLVHHVLALGHHLVAIFKRSFTEITGLVDIHISHAHIDASDVLHDILTFEQPVSYIRYNELEHHIYEHKYEEG